MYNELECAQYEAAESSCEERRCERLVCTNLVIGFLFALLAFTVGLIVGVLAIETFSTVVPVLIALAIVFAVIIAVILILRFCVGERNCRCRRRC